VSPDGRLLGDGGPVEQGRELLDSAGLPYFGSFIRRYVAHPQAQLDGVPITAYRGDRSWRAALDDIRRVQVELLLELGRLAPSARCTSRPDGAGVGTW